MYVLQYKLGNRSEVKSILRIDVTISYYLREHFGPGKDVTINNACGKNIYLRKITHYKNTVFKI